MILRFAAFITVKGSFTFSQCRYYTKDLSKKVRLLNKLRKDQFNSRIFMNMGEDSEDNEEEFVTETTSSLANGTSKVDSEQEKESIPQKIHTSTVCMVPPESAKQVWDNLTQARTSLKDPGLYRWPPHVNLLYPFIHFPKKSSNKSDILEAALDGLDEEDISSTLEDECLEKLFESVKCVEPFDVSLNKLGTFGGKRRGVLWMYPKSFRSENIDQHEEPLILLQKVLQETFPYCDDQQKSGNFNPHMTLTHCNNLEEAELLAKQIKEWWEPITFRCKEIYVLQRSGDSGQFKILAAIPLGLNSSGINRFNPPRPFSHMPEYEEDWVLEERMKLKKRRKRGRRRSRSSSRPKTSHVDNQK